MNIFSYIIILALFFEFTLDIVADILNLKALRNEVPAELSGIYEPDKYQRSQEYTRTRTRFGFITGTFGLVIILVFWFTGGFNLLDQLVRSWGFGSIVDGLFYTGIIAVAYSLVTLPFSIYSTFVIEERFEFNRTTPRTFVMDRLKGLLLLVVLGGPILAGILALFEYAGGFAWLYCWIGVTVYSLVMQYITPVWIMPLFNKFTPMEEGELHEAIESYADAAGYKVGSIMVMDGSKRSSKANAFFTGFGRTKRIAIFDTLISKHTVPELVAVLAHEVGHHKKKHIIQGTVISIAHSGLVFFLLSVLLGSTGLYEAFYMEQASVYTGLIFFGMLYTPVEMALSLALHQLSRRNEYQADRFAVETIDEPSSLADSLKKLSAENLSNLTPHPFYVFLNYSHPTLLQRVEAIRQYKK